MLSTNSQIARYLDSLPVVDQFGHNFLKNTLCRNVPSIPVTQEAYFELDHNPFELFGDTNVNFELAGKRYIVNLAKNSSKAYGMILS